MTDPLVFPIGLLVGTYHDRGDVGGHHHEIRRGGQIHELTDTEFVTWMLAHGAPEGAPDGPWTEPALLRHLTAQRLPQPAALVDGLLDRRLLAEVPPGDPVSFARTHRAVPTMLGLGSSSDEPGLYSIGLLGQERIRVSRLVFELWTWGHLDEDLWRACETIAALEKAPDGAAQADGPAEILDGFLGTLHGLLNAQAVYIDPVERP